MPQWFPSIAQRVAQYNGHLHSSDCLTWRNDEVVCVCYVDLIAVIAQRSCDPMSVRHCDVQLKDPIYVDGVQVPLSVTRVVEVSL